MKSPEWRWYEPQHALLGGEHYFTHAWGSIYVLSGTAAANIARMPEGALRFFANEGEPIQAPIEGCVFASSAAELLLVLRML